MDGAAAGGDASYGGKLVEDMDEGVVGTESSSSRD